MNNPYSDQIAEAFQAALPLLWDGKGRVPSGKEQFICHALEKAHKGGWRTAQGLVLSRLQRHNTLTNWLVSQGVPRKNITPKKAQAHRIAWVKLLIEEFSE